MKMNTLKILNVTSFLSMKEWEPSHLLPVVWGTSSETGYRNMNYKNKLQAQSLSQQELMYNNR